MKVLKAADAGVTAFEVYNVVVQELLNLPFRDSELSADELRRKCAILNVVEYLEHQLVVPDVHTIAEVRTPTDHAKATVQLYGLGASANTVVSQESLSELLDTLHAKYQLSQTELMQIADLGPTQLVDLYAIIEQSGDRYGEEDFYGMLDLCKAVFSQARSTCSPDSAHVDAQS